MKLSKKDICLLLIFSRSVQTQDCLEPADANRDVPYPPSTPTSSYLPSRTEAIMESYRFQCHGNVTTWWLYIAAPSDSLVILNYTFSFQVWRQASGFESSGCYILVGTNTFNKVGTFDKGLVKAVPLENDFIAVNPGDMVGVYASGNGSTGGVADPRIMLDASYGNETIWYHVNTPSAPLTYGSNPCYFSTGKEPDRSLRSLTTMAPILSVNMAPQSPFPSPSSTAAVSASQTPFISTASSAAASPFTADSVSMTIQTTSTLTPSVPFQPPTTGGLNPTPPLLIWWIWIIIGVAVVLLLLFLLLLFLVIVVILIAKKRKRKRRDKESMDQCSIITPYAESTGDLSEPIYAVIDVKMKDPDASAVPEDVEVVKIEVVANESYAMLATNSFIVHRYGSVEGDPNSEQPAGNRT